MGKNRLGMSMKCLMHNVSFLHTLPMPHLTGSEVLCRVAEQQIFWSQMGSLRGSAPFTTTWEEP
jgi:hypothetical protein